MTSVQMPYRLSAERSVIYALSPDSTVRELAQLRYDEHVHVQACQAAAKTISAACSAIESHVGGVINPNRPYLSWTCCTVHQALKRQREELAERAKLLGVEPVIDVRRVVLDD